MSELLLISFVNNGSFMDVDDGGWNLKGLSFDLFIFVNVGIYMKIGFGFIMF